MSNILGAHHELKEAFYELMEKEKDKKEAIKKMDKDRSSIQFKRIQ